MLSPADNPFRFHLDHSSDWAAAGRVISVRGWIYDRQHECVPAVRLQVADRIFPASTGQPRPDVAAACADIPAENTGFGGSALLPRGRTSVRIEARLPDGSWQTVFETSAVRRRQPPFWLGGGSPEELLAAQLTVMPRHPPRLRSVQAPRVVSPAVPHSDWPGLSIVTPSLNQAKFLSRTLESVTSQIDEGVHYVVQDGGSTDGSTAAIERHEASLHSWSSQPDAGQTDAILRGFEQTQGGSDDLMGWLNADDIYLPGALAWVRHYFAAHPKVDVLYADRLLIDTNDQETGRWYLPAHEPDVLKLYDFVPQETLFWRRRTWDRVGPLDPNFHFALDWDWLLRAQEQNACIVHEPVFLAAFRVHPAQKTSAHIHSLGQSEIDTLRRRTFGRNVPPAEIIGARCIERYLRRSARREAWARLFGQS